MKKALMIMLLAAIALPLFADDALVLPAQVLRVYVAPTYAFADKAYDADGKLQDISFGPMTAKVSLFDLGFAAEYGVTDWLTAAVQWAPGWTLSSKIDLSPTSPFFPADYNVNGVNDIFAGAKIQILGAKGLVENKVMRLALAPGVKLPMPDVDWDKQSQNLGAGKDATLLSLAKHAWGVGARAYFDYVINNMFFINLYSEYIMYFKRTNVEYDLSLAKADLEYGYDLTLEVEPHFTYMIADGMQIGAGLPVTYAMNPKLKVDGTAIDDTDGYTLSLSPNVSLFLMKFFLPLEIKASYGFPLMGKNSFAINNLTVQVKAYLKF